MLGVMTEPQFSGSEGGPLPPPPQSGYTPPPGPGYPPPPPSGFPPPYTGQGGPIYADPAAPYGRHPLTGEPYSDKSKTIAALLQLLGLVGILGIGRIYMGQTTFGIVQLVVGLVGACLLVPVIWGIIDCIVLMTGSPRDQQGRPLRDGT
jgi:TM2 domain-containing membrane protein YozV